MHQERGKETIAHIVRMFAGHDLNHIRQVEQIAKARKPPAKGAYRHVSRFPPLFAYDDWANREVLASLRAAATPPERAWN